MFVKILKFLIRAVNCPRHPRNRTIIDQKKIIKDLENQLNEAQKDKQNYPLLLCEQNFILNKQRKEINEKATLIMELNEKLGKDFIK